MNLGRYQILGNRHGITVYKNATVQTFNGPVTVPESFLALHFPACTVQRFSIEAGTFRARRFTIGPVTAGVFAYDANPRKKKRS